MKRYGDTNGSVLTRRAGRGVVLIIILLILVVLSVLTAGVSIQVAQAKRRQGYLIDYQQARYACDSGMKYAMAVIPEWNFAPVQRKGLPDFSDLFWMNPQQVEDYIHYWLATSEQETIDKVLIEEPEAEELEAAGDPDATLAELIGKLVEKMAMSDQELQAQYEQERAEEKRIDPNRVEIPGPYWVSWPYVTEPMEMEMGPAKVTITVEDENAKLPLSWLLLKDKRAEAALQHFCDWMQMTDAQVQAFQEQLEGIAKEKPYALDSKSILVKARLSEAAAKTTASRGRTVVTRTRTGTTVRTPTAPAQNELDKALAALADFSKLYHSSLLDTEMLARPIPETGNREISPLDYLSLWGADQVNINTAPRHVLEATFIFAGKAEEIADEIIRIRQERPIRSTKELRDELFGYANEIDKAVPYITTQSVFFRIRVDSTSGNAHCSAVTAVFKDRKNVKPLAMFYSR